MGPGETNNNHSNAYSQVSKSSMSRYVKNDFVGYASHGFQTRLLSQPTTPLLSCCWLWDIQGTKQSLKWGNWESQRGLGSWELLFGIAKMKDWDGPHQKWAAGKEYSFKESTVKQEKDNTCQSISI